MAKKLKPWKDLSVAVRRRYETAARKAGRGMSGAEFRRKVPTARAAARGHVAEKTERQLRERRSMQKFGASSARLRRLRREALHHIERELYGGTRKPVNAQEVEKGLRFLSAEALETILRSPAEVIRAYAALSYQAIVAIFPEFENDNQRNPFWYH
jgi:hypothetical protein